MFTSNTSNSYDLKILIKKNKLNKNIRLTFDTPTCERASPCSMLNLG